MRMGSQLKSGPFQNKAPKSTIRAHRCASVFIGGQLLSTLRLEIDDRVDAARLN